MKHDYDRLTIKYMVITIILSTILFILIIIMLWLLTPLLKIKEEGDIDLVAFQENLPFLGLLGIFHFALSITWFVFSILWLVNLFRWRDTLEFNSKEKTMLLVAIIMWFLFLWLVAWILVFLANSEAKKSSWEAKQNLEQKNKNI